MKTSVNKLCTDVRIQERIVSGSLFPDSICIDEHEIILAVLQRDSINANRGRFINSFYLGNENEGVVLRYSEP